MVKNSDLAEKSNTKTGNAKRYRHVIWDWNGTLIDDVWVCVEILNDMLRKRHLPVVTAERYREEFDFPIQEYYRRVGFDFSVEPYEKLAREFILEYDRRRFECSLQPGALHVLQSLADRGITQSILTAYHHERLDEITRFFSIQQFFTHLIGVNDDFASGKIENGKRFIALLDVPAENVVMVGDTNHDYDVSVAMGIDCVLIACGHQARRKLQACGGSGLDQIRDVLTIV